MTYFMLEIRGEIEKITDDNFKDVYKKMVYKKHWMSVKIEIVVERNFQETYFCYNTWITVLCQKEIQKTNE